MMEPARNGVDERELFSSGPVVVFKWKNAPGWPVEYASRNVEDVFGYSAEDFLAGKVRYAERIHPDDLERVAGEVAAASASSADEFTHKPYRVRRADGETIWLYDHTHILRDPVSGEPTHYHGYVIDITARVQAEETNRSLREQLLRTQKLESLGLLAGGLAHDFNNILMGILGHANVARHALEKQEAPDPTLLEACEQIEALSRQAGDFCKQLLAYSGQGRLERRPLDLGELVRETAAMLGVALPKAARLELELADSVPPVEGDRVQLQQVLMNLVTNAAEALRRGKGTVRIAVDRVELSLADTEGLVLGSAGLEPGPAVRLCVEDDGVGMNAETRARLFDPFFSTKFTGRGLGLAAVLGIVRSHGGGLRVDSRPGAGTRFSLYFPPAGATPAPVAVPRPPELRADGGRVLVVDDEPVVRRVARSMLEILGFEVLEAVDGEEALGFLAGACDDLRLVVLDATMPGLSGLEVLERLRERCPELPVVLNSGFNEAGFEVLAGCEGPVHFLQKPYTLEELSAVLDELLGPAPSASAEEE
ncbi:MAG: PAS domain-containing hybrid sensor histidine kinase/response regulator [Planctomycetota bacterium]|nr:MAG: PAS domain-containing hybrid sensor histidine kinase/response regulator [Planctomycetota bacterium]